MTSNEKIKYLSDVTCVMNSSKQLCISDALRFIYQGNENLALHKLEKAAQYALGFKRPSNW